MHAKSRRLIVSIQKPRGSGERVGRTRIRALGDGTYKNRSTISEVYWVNHLIEIPSTLVGCSLRGYFHPTGEVLWTSAERQSFFPLYSYDQKKAKIETSVTLKFMSSTQPSFVRMDKLSMFAYEDNITPLSELINIKGFFNNPRFMAKDDSCS